MPAVFSSSAKNIYASSRVRKTCVGSRCRGRWGWAMLMCGVSLKRQSCLHERGFELPSVLSLLKVLSPTRAHNVSLHASCRAQHSSAGWRQGPLAMLSRGALCSAPFFTGCGLNREWSGAPLSSAASSSADCFLPSTPACLAGFVASFEAESADCTRPRVSATSNSARRLQGCRQEAHAKGKKPWSVPRPRRPCP